MQANKLLGILFLLFDGIFFTFLSLIVLGQISHNGIREETYILIGVLFVLARSIWSGVVSVKTCNTKE